MNVLWYSIYSVTYLEYFLAYKEKSGNCSAYLSLLWWLRRVKVRVSHDAANHPNSDMKMDQGLKP